VPGGQNWQLLRKVAYGVLGWSPSDFWASTPWDLADAVEARAPKRDESEDEELRLASARAPDRVRSIEGVGRPMGEQAPGRRRRRRR